ncbi:MAG: SUMF1/EgtB/PvdO family nonheme iron enzyme [Cellvibrionaceae bacterium]|nr:SUMF1/EgtB/PvdO family nonheme iron enzyme [Cellvibrionaceae bacterium]
MNRREFLQSTATGSAALTISLSAPAVSNAVFAPTAAFPALDAFTFNTIQVNGRGNVVTIAPGEARYFNEVLSDTESLNMIAVQSYRPWLGNTDRSQNISPYEARPQSIDIAPFYLGRTAVTQGQWRAVAALPMVAKEIDPEPACFSGDNHPVECVSWHDAQEFCLRLSAKSGRNYRLPLEAEWESACRAGTISPFHYGATLSSELANYSALHSYDSEVHGIYRRSTVPVGQFTPNAFGLSDMHGNVWEWCADSWQSGADNANRRVLRGGSWADPPVKLRSASRMGYAAESLNRVIGFRIALSLEAA